jgi:hypothetical protein
MKGGNINNTVEITKKVKNRRFLKSLERYHIFQISKAPIQMNDFNVDHNNPTLEIIYQNYPNR